MGKRDYGHREPKKTKKGEQKTRIISELVSQPEVEVVRKKRKHDEEPEE